jgi:hypothetical protein
VAQLWRFHQCRKNLKKFCVIPGGATKPVFTLQEINTMATNKAVKLTAKERAEAEQWKAEYLTEYASGFMPAHVEACIRKELGDDFFAPVEAQAQAVKTAIAKAYRRDAKIKRHNPDNAPSFVLRDGRVLHPDGSVTMWRTGGAA